MDHGYDRGTVRRCLLSVCLYCCGGQRRRGCFQRWRRDGCGSWRGRRSRGWGKYRRWGKCRRWGCGVFRRWGWSKCRRWGWQGNRGCLCDRNEARRRGRRSLIAGGEREERQGEEGNYSQGFCSDEGGLGVSRGAPIFVPPAMLVRQNGSCMRRRRPSHTRQGHRIRGSRPGRPWYCRRR